MIRAQPVASPYLDMFDKSRAYGRHAKALALSKPIIDVSRPPPNSRLELFERRQTRIRSTLNRVSKQNLRVISSARTQKIPGGTKSISQTDWLNRLVDCEKKFSPEFLQSLSLTSSDKPMQLEIENGMIVIDPQSQIQNGGAAPDAERLSIKSDSGSQTAFH